MRLKRLGLPAFLLTLILLCSISVHTLYKIRDYGTLINYVGIVRGASQRLVKLELTDQPNDELKDYIDEILTELDMGVGKYSLINLNDEDYRTDLNKLKNIWEAIQMDIVLVREGNGHEKLLSDSEDLFEIANDTVFAVDYYTTTQSNYLLMMLMILSGISLVTWSIIIIFYLRSMITLQRKNNTLSIVAYRDNLTGVNNRLKFVLEARNIIKKTKGQFAFLYIDIEHFKYINDVFGYQFGDKILKKYAVVLANSIDKNETFARNNADSFIILRHYESKEMLKQKQIEIDQILIDYVKKAKNGYQIRLCCGICCYEDVIEKLTIDEYIDRAIFAQDTIKRTSEEHYAFYTEAIRNKLHMDKMIENRMQTALDNQEFLVYLQPKVNIKTGKIACAEALVRWKSEDRLIYPDLFIPIFEKNMHIKEIDKYVYREVCSWIRKRIDEELPCYPVSVNVSKVQFYNSKFVNEYYQIKQEFGIPDRMIEIEFTESVAFERTDLLIKIINDLRNYGFICSMDDFGKAYSSLNLLKDLPIDVLKLDSAFFEDSDNPDKVKLIIKDIIKMVNNLGIKTVAEGVEQVSQVEFLREVGCDLVQGYVYYKPMPINEYEKLIDKNS